MTWAGHRRVQYVIDVLLAAGFGVLPVLLGMLRNLTPGTRHFGPSPLAALVLLSLPPLALLVRRRAPIAVLGVTVACTAGVDALSPIQLAPLAALLALATVATYRVPRVSVPAAIIVALVSVPDAAVHGGWDAILASVYVALATAAWAIGETLRVRRVELDALRDGAERAVIEEQARIARELHDVIAHNVSVMVVQAAAARDVFDTHPDRAREALGSIEATGRTAMRELRRLLGVVRSSDVDVAARAPQPGLDRLEALVDQVRAAGLAVTMQTHGEPRELPTGVDLSAYRIVQEALTNTLRHAGATSAQVRIVYGPDAVGVEVVDDGRGGSTGGVGHGIVGMRERAALLGGELHVEAPDSGGFLVRAELPSGVGART